MTKLEQLNIEGKRSGEGFVAHKAILVNALSRAVAERVVLTDFNLGCKGLTAYLRSLGGSNIVKIVPSTVSASPDESGQADGDKRLKVICGTTTGYLSDGEWIDDNTSLTFCEVRVSPKHTVKPNIGASELADTLSRVLPFAATDDSRPVMQCVKVTAKDGKLTFVTADGYRLAVHTLDYDDGEGSTLINRDDLKGVASALRKAKRARVSFETDKDSPDGISLVVDTEIIRYRFNGFTGDYPDYEKLIPKDFKTLTRFDTVDAIKAVNSLQALSGNGKEYPVDLTIGDGKLVLSNPDDKGLTELPAETDGESMNVRLDGKYLSDALRACGGMVDLNIVNGYSPVMFQSDGYSLVVMPMMTDDSNKQAEADRQARREKEKEAEKAEAVAEAEKLAREKPKAKPKAKKRTKVKEPVTV
ncbi:MAG: DNA polymerase III subunit beta [Dehalococcoidia bacterium]